jgi:hypothetical protein
VPRLRHPLQQPPQQPSLAHASQKAPQLLLLQVWRLLLQLQLLWLLRGS